MLVDKQELPSIVVHHPSGMEHWLVLGKGRKCIVGWKNGDRWVGILGNVDARGVQLCMVRKLKKNEPMVPPADQPWRTKRIESLHCPLDQIREVVVLKCGGDGSRVDRDGFCTDTEISKSQQGAQRTLQPWKPDGSVDTASLGQLSQGSSQRGPWNQFDANEKLFGVKSSYDESLYTTTLVKSSTPEFTAREREAERVAKRILSKEAKNVHVKEERGQKVESDNVRDEEDRYSGVARNVSLSAAAPAFVPRARPLNVTAPAFIPRSFMGQR